MSDLSTFANSPNLDVELINLETNLEEVLCRVESHGEYFPELREEVNQHIRDYFALQSIAQTQGIKVGDYHDKAAEIIEDFEEAIGCYTFSN